MSRKELAIALAPSWNVTAGRADVDLELMIDVLAERAELHSALNHLILTRRAEIAKEEFS